MRFKSTLLFSALMLGMIESARPDTFTLKVGDQVDTFQLPASPVVTSSSNVGFTMASVPINEGGVQVIREIVFFNAAIGGGLLIQGANGSDFNGQGNALYIGSNKQPTFLTGTFNLAGAESGVLSIHQAAVAPEPTTTALIVIGLFSVLGALRLKMRSKVRASKKAREVSGSRI